MPPAVSVIIAAFLRTPHEQALLDETLASVQAQRHRALEVIVVDDGSVVDVDRIARHHPNTRVLRQSNMGPARARNTGIAACRGSHVVFLDADDHLLPGAIEAGLDVLHAHPEAGFCIGAREEMTYEGSPVPWQVAPPPGGSHIYEALLAFDWYIIPPSSAMFRREVVDTIGGFRDPWGADDLDFYLRAARAFPAVCHSTKVTRYRRYSTSSSRDGERMLRSVRAVYARQRPVVAGNDALERALETGLNRLTRIFQDCLLENLADRARAGELRRTVRTLGVLARERPAAIWDAIFRIYASLQVAGRRAERVGAVSRVDVARWPES